MTGYADTLFTVDILDASGNRLGDGPLRNITSLKDTRSLDRIGTLTFTLPAGDPRQRYFQQGSQFDVFTRDEGYLGRYWFRSQSIEYRDGAAEIAIECFDTLRELSNQSVFFRRKYQFQDVADVITDLVSLVPGWAARVDEGIGNTTISYEGESVLIAVDALRDRWGQHYRLATTTPGLNVLEFGSFGATAPVTLVNATASTAGEMDANSAIAYVKTIRELQDRDDIYNTIIPLGAGEGTAQLTIERATLGSFDVKSGVNQDGSTFYYIEDAASVARFGRIWRVATYKTIRPLTNSDANITNAANALKLTAETMLRRRSGLIKSYAVTVVGLRQNINVGDRVPVRFSGIADSDNYSYLDIDESLWVMDVSRQRAVNGNTTVSLTVATDDQRRTSDTDVMLQIVNDLNALKIHVPTVLTYRDFGPYERRIDGSNTATFTVRIKDEVLALNRAIMTLRTSPLKSSVQSTAAAASSVGTSGGGGGTSTSTEGGGGTTATSAGGGDHDHDLFQFLADGTVSGTARRFNTLIRRSSGGDLLALLELNIAAASASTTWQAAKTFTASGDHTHALTISDHTHDLELSDHTHSVTVPSHDHTMNYGLFADTIYPQSINVAIDGVDRTAALGGPWAPSNAAVELELDITDYLADAAGGLRQDHTITVSCTSGRGEVEVGCEMLCTIQPIAVS
jgi:hypothetical protein